jgi:hypothetical protein
VEHHLSGSGGRYLTGFDDNDSVVTLFHSIEYLCLHRKGIEPDGPFGALILNHVE